MRSLCLNFQGEDRNELKRHIFSRSVDRVAVKRLVKRIFEPCKCHHRPVTQETSVFYRSVALLFWKHNWHAYKSVICIKVWFTLMVTEMAV